MNLYLPDTHAVFWYEFRDAKLSNAAAQVFEDAQAGRALLVIHPVVLAEFYWLLKKANLHSSFKPYVQFVRSNPIYRLETILIDDILRLEEFAEIPEMHDRLIAIAADRLGATVITKDSELQASSKVKCIW
jgi:PIN domain nuclease of toxin-antitoxin system